MPGAQQGPSFIPKRTPTKHKRRGPRRMYVFSYVAYILIFGAVLTAAGVFIYKLQVEAQMVERQKTLSDAVNDFNQSELEMVKEFEQRLHFAQGRMQHHYAPSRILTFFEEVTAVPVQINELLVSRVDDELFEVTGTIITNTFNSTIFQRDLLRSETVVSAAFVEGARLANLDEGSEASGRANAPNTSSNSSVETIEFTLLIRLDPSFVTYEGISRPAATFPQQGTAAGTLATNTPEANQNSL